MSYTVVECEQRSPAWYAARVGLLTATDAAAMLSVGRKAGEDAAGKARLRIRLALEAPGDRADERRVGYENEAMRRGRELEPEGLGVYEVVTGDLVQPVGFIRHDTLPIGCSPDGIVGDFEGGVELKCPEDHTHFAYLSGGVVPSEYRAQVLHSLFVTGLPWWDFCSYNPHPGFKNARLFRVRVSAGDVDLDAYALALAIFFREVQQVRETLSALSGARELVHG